MDSGGSKQDNVIRLPISAAKSAGREKARLRDSGFDANADHVPEVFEAANKAFEQEVFLRQVLHNHQTLPE